VSTLVRCYHRPTRRVWLPPDARVRNGVTDAHQA